MDDYDDRSGSAVRSRSGTAESAGATGSLSDRVRSLRLADTAPPPASGAAVAIPWLLCLILSGACAWLAYSAYGQTSETAETDDVAVVSEESASAASVVAKSAPADAKGIALESKGYIIPAHQILVSPKVNGMLVEFSVEEGKRVQTGDVLGLIEDTEYQADFHRAQATCNLAKQRLLELQNGNRPEEIGQAEAELAESNAQLKQLELESKRIVELRKKNVVSQQDSDVAESQFWAMQRRVQRLEYSLKLMQLGPRIERIEVARAEVQQAEADLARSAWRLSNCTIRAPISGTILKKNAEQWNIVNPIAFNGSFSLCEMADLSDLEVDLNIQERDVSRVFQGQRCQVRAEAFPDRVYQGTVSRLMPIADRAKGAVPVRVKVTVPANEEGVYLKPEMGVIVTFFSVAEAN